MFTLSTKEKLSESMNGNDMEKARAKIEAFLCGLVANSIKYEIGHDGSTYYLKGTIAIDELKDNRPRQRIHW